MALDILTNITTLVVLIYGVISLGYVSLSIYIIYRGKKEFTRGYIRRFLTIFSLMLSISFFYALWSILLRLRIIHHSNEFMILIENLLLLTFFIILSYSAFLAKIITNKFGFKTRGLKVMGNAKSKSKN